MRYFYLHIFLMYASRVFLTSSCMYVCVCVLYMIGGFVFRCLLTCQPHVQVRTNFRRNSCYISLNQAQTHLDYLKVLDELWNIFIEFEIIYPLEDLYEN